MTDLNRLRAASDAATPGPWAVDGDGTSLLSHHGWTVVPSDEAMPNDAAFIALSANHTRALLAGDAATWADLLASAPVEALAGALEAVMDDVPRDIANRADSAARGATPMDPWEEETNYHAVVSAYLRALATGDAP